jgi:hypothetical protein
VSGAPRYVIGTGLGRIGTGRIGTEPAWVELPEEEWIADVVIADGLLHAVRADGWVHVLDLDLRRHPERDFRAGDKKAGEPPSFTGSVVTVGEVEVDVGASVRDLLRTRTAGSRSPPGTESCCSRRPLCQGDNLTRLRSCRTGITFSSSSPSTWRFSPYVKMRSRF